MRENEREWERMRENEWEWERSRGVDSGREETS